MFVSSLVVTFSALIQKRWIRVGTRVDFKNLLSFDSYFYWLTTDELFCCNLDCNKTKNYEYIISCTLLDLFYLLFHNSILLSFVASHSWFGDDQEWGFNCTSLLTTPRTFF